MFRELFLEALNSLDKDAQKVWSAKGIDAKRTAILAMIGNMKGKPSQAKYTKQANEIQVPDKLDKLAANLMLSDKNKLV